MKLIHSLMVLALTSTSSVYAAVKGAAPTVEALELRPQGTVAAVRVVAVAPQTGCSGKSESTAHELKDDVVELAHDLAKFVGLGSTLKDDEPSDFARHMREIERSFKDLVEIAGPGKGIPPHHAAHAAERFSFWENAFRIFSQGLQEAIDAGQKEELARLRAEEKEVQLQFVRLQEQGVPVVEIVEARNEVEDYPVVYRQLLTKEEFAKMDDLERRDQERAAPLFQDRMRGLELQMKAEDELFQREFQALGTLEKNSKDVPAVYKIAATQDYIRRRQLQLTCSQEIAKREEARRELLSLDRRCAQLRTERQGFVKEKRFAEAGENVVQEKDLIARYYEVVPYAFAPLSRDVPVEYEKEQMK